MESDCTLLQTVEDAVVLLLVEFVRGLTLARGVDHEFDEALADDGGAEHDRDELVDLGLNLGVETAELEVAATVTALTDHALGNTVEGSELETVVGTVRVLLLKLPENALEAVELALEDVGLVDLIGHHDEVLLVGEVEDGADVVLRERRAGGVARVDDDNGTDIGAVGLGLFVGTADRLEVGAPVLGLIEVVGNACCVEDGEGGGVERVLRDRDEDAGVGSGANDVKQGVDTGGGTGGEVDLGGVGGEAISAWYWVSVNVTACKSRPVCLRSRNLAMLSLMAGTPEEALYAPTEPTLLRRVLALCTTSG